MNNIHTRPMRRILGAAIVSTAMAFPSLAQQPAPIPGTPTHQGMPGMSSPNMPMTGASAAESPSTKAFKAANDKMMQGMNAPMTGNADRDFVGGMIPHHAGAIDMAKIQIRYGKDPKLVALAKSIVVAQEKEIAEMKAWQKAHPVQP